MIYTLTRDRTLRVRGGGAELGGERQGASFRPCGRNYGRSDEGSVTYAAVALPPNAVRTEYTAQLISLIEAEGFYSYIASLVSPKKGRLPRY